MVSVDPVVVAPRLVLVVGPAPVMDVVEPDEVVVDGRVVEVGRSRVVVVVSRVVEGRGSVVVVDEVGIWASAGV